MLSEGKEVIAYLLNVYTTDSECYQKFAGSDNTVCFTYFLFIGNLFLEMESFGVINEQNQNI